MHDEQIQKLIQSVRKAALSVEEKSALKNQILLKMDQPVLIPGSKIFNIFERTSILFGSFRPAYGLALLAIFVLTGGISFAAEGALPGNFLYPIKVKINEKISSALTIGSLNKAERESKLIDKRLKEFKILSKNGELSNEKIKIVEDQISIHTENSKGHIKALEEKKDFEGALSVQTKLKSSLMVNEKIITDVGKENKSITSIVLQAKEELSNASDKKDSLEKTFDIAIISGLKLKTAKLAFLEASDFVKVENENFAGVEEKVSSDAQTTSLKVASEVFVLSPEEKILKLIELKIATGEILLKNGDYEKATKLFEEAYQFSRNIVLSPGEIKNQMIEEDLESQGEKEPISTNQNIPLSIKEKNSKELEKEKIEIKSEVKGESTVKGDLKQNSSADVSSILPKEIRDKNQNEKIEENVEGLQPLY